MLIVTTIPLKCLLPLVYYIINCDSFALKNLFWLQLASAELMF